MAIEKMTLVAIEGTLKRVNKTLMKCCESNCFHIIPSTHPSEGYHSNQGFKTLKAKNHYLPIIKRGEKIAEDLDIDLIYCEYDDIEMNVSVDFAEYFKNIENGYSELQIKREKLLKDIAQHSTVLDQIENLAGLSSDFNEIFALKYIKVRFGRLPLSGYEKLEYLSDKAFMFFPFETQGDYIWGAYFVPSPEKAQIDDIFNSLFFERVIIPDYITGDAEYARKSIVEFLERENAELLDVNRKLSQYRDHVSEEFLKIHCKLCALSESHELRADVSVINNRFYLSGYVPARRIDEFKQAIEDLGGVNLQSLPPDSDPSYTPPVRLRNNFFVRPFEMFVEMYGLPHYGRIDPTGFLAVTYFLIYGIMFGDVGQGFLLLLFGFLLHNLKKVKLGAVMERLGLSGMLFGFFYGSVFGNEHIIKPFFHRKQIYSALGFNAPPENIFEVSRFLIIGSLAIGVLIILISILLNIYTSIKVKNFQKAILSPNGISGIVFYSSLVTGVVANLVYQLDLFSPFYVIGLIVTPLALMFFSHPIAHLAQGYYKKYVMKKIHRNMTLVNAIKTYSDAISEVSAVISDGSEIDSLLECRYIRQQYGKLSYESYQKLELFKDRNFVFYPFESDDKYVSGIYISPEEEFPGIERIFATLGFIKGNTPVHIKDIQQQTNIPKETISHTGKNEEKFSLSNFLIEGSVELFEIVLNYLTNTLSFMRIGGFIMSHAGLMMVVNIMAEKTNGGLPWLLVQIIGNLFVLGIEGFLVGIQVLRLEFYEMFSRYYEGGGKPFKPVVVEMKIH